MYLEARAGACQLRPALRYSKASHPVRRKFHSCSREVVVRAGAGTCLKVAVEKSAKRLRIEYYNISYSTHGPFSATLSSKTRIEMEFDSVRQNLTRKPQATGCNVSGDRLKTSTTRVQGRTVQCNIGFCISIFQ